MGMAESFWAKVKKSDGCWEWQASIFKQTGYGQSWAPGPDGRGYMPTTAHRVAFLLTYGEIPSGMAVCHTCDNPLCVRPEHLFLGTDKDNAMDKARKGRAAKKLTKEQVEEIRRLYAAGGVTLKALARQFRVDAALIPRIIRREIWNWV